MKECCGYVFKPFLHLKWMRLNDVDIIMLPTIAEVAANETKKKPLIRDHRKMFKNISSSIQIT